MEKRIIITGGGTGGHLYPALAIIESIQGLGEISYVGNPDKIEGQVVPTKNIPFFGIKFKPFPKNKLHYPGYLLLLLRKVLEGRKLLRQIKPNLVIAVGGYVCIPLAIAAKSMRIPVILHEQNVHPGKANRLLARMKISVMITFEETKRYFPKNKIYTTGCPVRKTIGTLLKSDTLNILNYPNDKTIILIVGGSGGALAINEAIPELIKLCNDRRDLFFIHVTGRRYYSAVIDNFKKISPENPDNYQIIEYADNIDQLYAIADIVIARSGSSTVNELLCGAIPAILIPSPNVSENHQEGNARFAESVGAAKVILEKELSPERIADVLNETLENTASLSSMKEQARKHCKGREAARLIRQTIESLL